MFSDTNHYKKPMPPTSSLPPLARLSSYSLALIKEALHNVRILYFPSQAPNTPPIPLRALPKHLIHDTSVPDSGYASSEEDEDEMTAFKSGTVVDISDDEDIAILRSDTMERDFAIRWLTRFAARSDVWVYSPDVTTEEEESARAEIVDDAAKLLASFARDDEEEEVALIRTFSFSAGKGYVEVELNDAPLVSDDHTSVGLQSWASSIILSERLCANPISFGFPLGLHLEGRILELGAGTGLVSIVLAKLHQVFPLQIQKSDCTMIATDYHPSVLANLKTNILHNFPSASVPPIEVLPLDWESPVYEAPFDNAFDVIVAADVIYHPEHAQWIKTCVTRLLRRPSPGEEGGIFWMMIAVRSTGRHEGLAGSVDAVFPSAAAITPIPGEPRLVILQKDLIRRQDGVGRVDESAYMLFKIGWV